MGDNVVMSVQSDVCVNFQNYANLRNGIILNKFVVVNGIFRQIFSKCVSLRLKEVISTLLKVTNITCLTMCRCSSLKADVSTKTDPRF